MRLKRSHSTPASALGADPRAWLAFGLGSGLVPYAPGTWGALIGLPVAWGLHQGGEIAYVAATILITLAGIYLCGYTARRLGVHDHPGINLDEVAGQLVACVLVPSGWGWYLLAFALFRLFDILKPGPIGWIDRHFSGGLGIMLDDIAAGAVAGFLVWGVGFLVM